MNFRNKTVLITGGASGIGLSLASHFVQRDSTVVICGRNKGKLEEAKARYPQITTYVCDVANSAERIAMFKWISSEFPKLNILINNAGIQRRGLQFGAGACLGNVERGNNDQSGGSDSSFHVVYPTATETRGSNNYQRHFGSCFCSLVDCPDLFRYKSCPTFLYAFLAAAVGRFTDIGA